MTYKEKERIKLGKKKLYRGVIFGAIVGGIIALFDKDARDYAADKVKEASGKAKYYLSNPSEAIHDVRVSVDKLNQDLVKGVENTVNALEQVEDTLNKLTKK